MVNNLASPVDKGQFKSGRGFILGTPVKTVSSVEQGLDWAKNWKDKRSDKCP